MFFLLSPVLLSGSFSSDENEEEDHNPCQSLRWQANKELSSFLGKPLSPFEQKAVTKRYSRSKLDSLYTLTKENYLPSLVPGIKTVDKRTRFLQDRVSTTFGPATTLFERIYGLLAEAKSAKNVILSCEQVKDPRATPSNAFHTLGNASALLLRDVKLS